MRWSTLQLPFRLPFRKRTIAISLLMAAAMAIAATPAAVPVVGMRRHVTASGATEVSAGSVVVSGTFGQPFVGTSAQHNVALEHGFWHSVPPTQHTVFMPLVMRAFA